MANMKYENYSEQKELALNREKKRCLYQQDLYTAHTKQQQSGRPQKK